MKVSDVYIRVKLADHWGYHAIAPSDTPHAFHSLLSGQLALVVSGKEGYFQCYDPDGKFLDGKYADGLNEQLGLGKAEATIIIAQSMPMLRPTKSASHLGAELRILCDTFFSEGLTAEQITNELDECKDEWQKEWDAEAE